MTLSGKGRRAKGMSGQREVAELLRPIWPEAHSGYWQHTGGDACADVEGTPYFIEVKRGTCSRYKALWQATDNADSVDDRVPVAFTRRDRMPWLVSMWNDNFCNLAMCADMKFDRVMPTRAYEQMGELNWSTVFVEYGNETPCIGYVTCLASVWIEMVRRAEASDCDK